MDPFIFKGVVNFVNRRCCIKQITLISKKVVNHGILFLQVHNEIWNVAKRHELVTDNNNHWILIKEKVVESWHTATKAKGKFIVN